MNMDIKLIKQRWLLQLIIVIFGINNISSSKETTTDLSQAESSRSKLEIIKQIKKINEDGSYTIGYEADDGSFKIESRDVLGNIKGTYGFIDENGEIKRVTYSSNNESEITSTTPTVVQRIPKVNRNYTTLLRHKEKPPIVATTPPVAQTVPRRRFVFPTHSTTTTKPSPSPSNQEVNVVYAQSVVNSALPASKEERQLSKPVPEEIPSTESTLLKHTLETSLSEADSTVKPVTEEPEVHGNNLRRQLFQERRPQFDPRQYNADFADIYTGSKTTGTPRPPLFTTTVTSRDKPFFSTTTRAINASPFVAKPEQTTPIPRHHFDIPEYAKSQTTTESGSGTEEYRTQIPVQGLPTPPYLQNNQRFAAVQHPDNGRVILVPAGHPILSQLRVNKQYPLETVNDYEIYPQAPQNHIRDSPPVENNRIASGPNVLYGTLVAATRRPNIPLKITNVEHNLQREIDEIETPVSVSDFQKILDQLIIRQKKLETVNSLVNSQVPDPLSRATMIIIQPRNPYPHITYRNPDYDPGLRNDQVYSQSKRMVVQNRIDTDENREKFLPPVVREMLLLKMLKLAINPYLPIEADTEGQYSMNRRSTIIKTGQRNVEILGEETEGDTTSEAYRRNKRFAKDFI